MHDARFNLISLSLRPERNETWRSHLLPEFHLSHPCKRNRRCVGGNNGIALGKLIQRSRWLTGSTVRLMRVGMWLPCFLLWTYSQFLLANDLPSIFRLYPFSLATGNRRVLFSFLIGMLAMTTGAFRFLLPLPCSACRTQVLPALLVHRTGVWPESVLYAWLWSGKAIFETSEVLPEISS